MFKRLTSLTVLIAFIATSVYNPSRAYGAPLLGLPEPGTMVSLSNAYEPAMIKGLTLDPKNPFIFDFIIDAGNSGLKVENPQLKEESTKLIKYFLAALTIPEKDLWVNLSPYEKDRILPQNLSQTEMGRDMLAQDYLLKQITASLIYPEKELGKNFWNKVYTKAQALYGTSQIPVNTFNKVWIVADKADVFERGQTAFVMAAHLKVMLEEDYLALDKNMKNSPSSTIASQIIRDIVIPELEKEVNEGKNFAPLRQMFHSMILAAWFKKALKQAVVTELYADQGKTKVGVNQADVASNQQIYERYLQAYKKGVFNYIKEDIDSSSKEAAPKKYFSGGVTAAMTVKVLAVKDGPVAAEETGKVFRGRRLFGATTRLLSQLPSSFSEAMMVPLQLNIPQGTELKPLFNRLRADGGPLAAFDILLPNGWGRGEDFHQKIQALAQELQPLFSTEDSKEAKALKDLITLDTSDRDNLYKLQEALMTLMVIHVSMYKIQRPKWDELSGKYLIWRDFKTFITHSLYYIEAKKSQINAADSTIFNMNANSVMSDVLLDDKIWRGTDSFVREEMSVRGATLVEIPSLKNLPGFIAKDPNKVASRFMDFMVHPHQEVVSLIDAILGAGKVTGTIDGKNLDKLPKLLAFREVMRQVGLNWENPPAVEREVAKDVREFQTSVFYAMPDIIKNHTNPNFRLQNALWFIKGHPSQEYHNLRHSINAANVGFNLFRELNYTQEKQIFMYLVGLLHDLDPNRASNSPARVLATLELLDNDWNGVMSLDGRKGKSFLKDNLGLSELEFWQMKAIIQRSEFPFTAPHPNPAYKGNSAFERYVAMVRQIKGKYGAEEAEFVLNAAPIFSEFVDKFSFYAQGDFTDSLSVVDALAQEMKVVVPHLGLTAEKLNTAGFLNSLGQPEAFKLDRLANRIIVSDEPIPILEEALRVEITVADVEKLPLITLEGVLNLISPQNALLFKATREGMKAFQAEYVLFQQAKEALETAAKETTSDATREMLQKQARELQFDRKAAEAKAREASQYALGKTGDLGTTLLLSKAHELLERVNIDASYQPGDKDFTSPVMPLIQRNPTYFAKYAGVLHNTIFQENVRQGRVNIYAPNLHRLKFVELVQNGAISSSEDVLNFTHRYTQDGEFTIKRKDILNVNIFSDLLGLTMDAKGRIESMQPEETIVSSMDASWEQLVYQVRGQYAPDVQEKQLNLMIMRQAPMVSDLLTYLLWYRQSYLLQGKGLKLEDILMATHAIWEKNHPEETLPWGAVPESRKRLYYDILRGMIGHTANLTWDMYDFFQEGGQRFTESDSAQAADAITANAAMSVNEQVLRENIKIEGNTVVLGLEERYKLPRQEFLSIIDRFMSETPDGRWMVDGLEYLFIETFRTLYVRSLNIASEVNYKGTKPWFIPLKSNNEISMRFLEAIKRMIPLKVGDRVNVSLDGSKTAVRLESMRSPGVFNGLVLSGSMEGDPIVIQQDEDGNLSEVTGTTAGATRQPAEAVNAAMTPTKIRFSGDEIISEGHLREDILRAFALIKENIQLGNVEAEEQAWSFSYYPKRSKLENNGEEIDSIIGLIFIEIEKEMNDSRFDDLYSVGNSRDNTRFRLPYDNNKGDQGGENWARIEALIKRMRELIIAKEQRLLSWDDGDPALIAKGGIDFDANKMGMNVSKEGAGVDITFDPAMVERMKRDGFDGFVPVIINITPVVSILPLLGLAPRREEEEQLAGV